MPESRLPKGGENKFQKIKRICAEAAAKGIKLWKLSIGQPAGPALLSARRAASRSVLSGKESMHEYQDNGSPGVPDFASRFVKAHVPNAIFYEKEVSFLPIPGIKPMLAMIPLACGASQKPITVLTHTNPGYPTPADVCDYIGVSHADLFADHMTDFRFSPNSLPRKPDLIMMNFPHNPSGQIAPREWLEGLCAKAKNDGFRLFNDGAYTMLDHSGKHVSLAEVAINFPGLSWAEAFSASKTIANGCGWRIGAMVGSPDFIADIATIKGNMDSGFAAPMAAGALYAAEHDRHNIEAHRRKYARRLDLLGNIMVDSGMRETITPEAGFFSLWHSPVAAFGRKVTSSDHFNELMIGETGIVMVDFKAYIRAAVTQPIEHKDFTAALVTGFKKAQVRY